jgi:hypothetical protein
MTMLPARAQARLTDTVALRSVGVANGTEDAEPRRLPLQVAGRIAVGFRR